MDIKFAYNVNTFAKVASLTIITVQNAMERKEKLFQGVLAYNHIMTTNIYRIVNPAIRNV